MLCSGNFLMMRTTWDPQKGQHTGLESKAQTPHRLQCASSIPTHSLTPLQCLCAPTLACCGFL